jgi:hypothetical protein
VGVPVIKSAIIPARFTLWYFSLIGLGFMFVEIAFMQQIILFLGHPTYSLALVLGILLLASGVGSAYSPRISLRKGFTGLICMLVILTIGLSMFIHGGMGRGIAVKSIMLFCMLAIPSFFMGIPFPAGLRTLHPDQVPYAWCVNGCASVCGSVLSVIIAISWGFQAVLALGLVCYVVAALIAGKSCQWSDEFR